MDMKEPTNAVLLKSLDMRKRVAFEYDGLERIVEVHTIGTTTTGKPCIRAYQVAGGSISAEFEGWKMFTLSRVHNVKLMDTDAALPRPGYQRDDRGMSTIEAQV